jgi:hypothetical protein
MDEVNEFAAWIEESGKAYLGKRTQALRFREQQQDVAYSWAKKEVEIERGNVEASVRAASAWIRDARAYNCASVADLDRLEGNIARTMLMVKDAERTHLPEGVW